MNSRKAPLVFSFVVFFGVQAPMTAWSLHQLGVPGIGSWLIGIALASGWFALFWTMDSIGRLVR